MIHPLQTFPTQHHNVYTMYREVVEGLGGVAKVIVAVREEGVVFQRRDKVDVLPHSGRDEHLSE